MQPMTTPHQTAPDTPPLLAEPIAVASLNGRKPKSLDLAPDTEALQHVAAYLGFTALRKMRFRGTLAPKGREDWELSGQLGATIVQPCSVTLAPVTTRIDTPLSRVFVADWHEPVGEEVEMTLDDSLEPLGQRIDLSALLIEALALAAPDFPRASGAEMAPEGVLRAAPEGDSPLDDAAVKPFAALAALRDKMDRG
ncbi:DUF177 domain-containing protein [Roseibaca sp. Y0-43]|uniref:DUF177 domain-containing protein n=1 Tax=Roseibaca sp. Y0-43 TaxID=2816854 RepID=UPI001D0C1473|nr:YceD family protein [Roseibaca sp. Y0-43]